MNLHFIFFLILFCILLYPLSVKQFLSNLLPNNTNSYHENINNIDNDLNIKSYKVNNKTYQNEKMKKSLIYYLDEIIKILRLKGINTLNEKHLLHYKTYANKLFFDDFFLEQFYDFLSELDVYITIELYYSCNEYEKYRNLIIQIFRDYSNN